MRSDEEYIAILLAADDPELFEWPKCFDLKAEWQRFTRLANAVDEALGIPCKRDGENDVQDASYLAAITLPDETLAKPLATVRFQGEDLPQHAQISVSNWASLAVIFKGDQLEPEVFQTLERLLQEHGYTPIPERILQLPYTGPNPYVPRYGIWGNRYFDWS